MGNEQTPYADEDHVIQSKAAKQQPNGPCGWNVFSANINFVFHAKQRIGIGYLCHNIVLLGQIYININVFLKVLPNS